MTYGGYGGGPYGPPGGNPFETPPGPGPVPGPTPPRPAPPGTHSEVNTLATLSVVFAFVFPPAGAILGHIGLGQIAASGQRGRERALVGVTLSYAFIVALIVALVVWAALGDSSVQHTAAPAATTSASTTTTVPTTTTTTTTPPPPPTVAPADLSKLLLGNDELATIMDAPALANHFTITEPSATTEETFDPADCEGAMYPGRTQSFQGSGLQAFYGLEHDNRDVHALAQVNQSVAAFADAAAAQGFRTRMVDLWRHCAASRQLTLGGSHAPVTFTLGDPVDNAGIATVRQVGPVARNAFVRAVAAKSNVVVDLLVVGSNSVEQATTIATRILQRIPE